MKIMVTGSRHMGVCAHWKGDKHPCEPSLRHRHLMDRAMRERVHGLSRLASGAHDDPSHPMLDSPLKGETLELWHGAAEGADTLAASYWEAYRFGSIHGIPANWDVLGRRAGHFRNELLIAQMPDMLLAFPWVGKGNQPLSPGTRDAMWQASQAHILTYTYPIREVCPAIFFPR